MVWLNECQAGEGSVLGSLLGLLETLAQVGGKEGWVGLASSLEEATFEEESCETSA